MGALVIAEMDPRLSFGGGAGGAGEGTYRRASCARELVSAEVHRMIITMNFDRLLAQAISAERVQPTVIRPPDAVKRAPPLVHTDLLSVKIHGHCLGRCAPQRPLPKPAALYPRTLRTTSLSNDFSPTHPVTSPSPRHCGSRRETLRCESAASERSFTNLSFTDSLSRR